MPRVVALITVITLAVTACGGDDTTDGPDPEAVARGIALYEGNCQVCHGIEGAGVEGLGKPWVDSSFIQARTDQEMLEFIIEGRPSDHPDNTTGIAMMPRAGNPNLTDDQILDLVAYMRTLNP
jgi:mono/diheme cytochrome c family protein